MIDEVSQMLAVHVKIMLGTTCSQAKEIFIVLEPIETLIKIKVLIQSYCSVDQYSIDRYYSS